MAWWVRTEDKWRSTDDLTVNEVLAIEQVAGEPWTMVNPYRNGTSAKALFAAFLVRDGASDEDAAKRIGAMSLGDFRERFRYREDTDLPKEWEDGLPVVDPKPEADDPSTD